MAQVVHAAVECIRMAVQNFGLKALGAQSKAVVKLSVALLEASATAAPVRAEAKLLAVELHRFMGAALRPSYDNLRPAQQQDLDSAFAEAPPPAPTRMTRSAAAARAAAGEEWCAERGRARRRGGTPRGRAAPRAAAQGTRAAPVGSRRRRCSRLRGGPVERRVV